MNRYIRKTVNIVTPLIIGAGILYWMYRDFDIDTMLSVLRNEMNWWWMLASMPFGILAQTFRAWRWRQALAPLNEHPRTSTCMDAIYLSYAASLLVPRIGEFTRCGVLAKWEGTSFPKALGTVVTERAVDSLIILLITAAVFLGQLPVFLTFFSRTGTKLDDLTDFLGMFSTTGYIVTLICAILAIMGLYIIRRKLAIYDKVKTTLRGIMDGVMSLKNVQNVPLFIFYSIAIWASYFLHYYITFYCFSETAQLSITCAMVTFIVGSIAVLVPTPNGAGSWHFAVKTMLILYGITDTTALYFVLIVHTLQTLLVAVLGIYAWMALSLRKKNTSCTNETNKVL